MGSGGTGGGSGGSGGAGIAGGAGPAKGVTITWFGHSTFLITSPRGVRVLTDPYPGNLGYGNRGFSADIVTVSHEHFDHNSVASVGDDPVVLRALSKADWAQAEKSQDDVSVVSIGGTYHDSTKGSQRGKNGLFLIEAGGLRILHLGDIGAPPPAEVVKTVGRVDILMIPVGGLFTIDGQAATEVAALFSPKVVIPMHYKTAAIADWQISDEKPFTEGKPDVKHIASGSVTVDQDTLPARPEIWVLGVAGGGQK